MPSQNEQLVRTALDAWSRHDLATLVELSHTDIVYVNAPDAVEPGTRRGREQVTAAMEKQWDLLEDARLDVDVVHDRGEVILVETVISSRMHGSSGRIENRLLMSWTCRDGAIERIEVLGGGSGFEEASRLAGLG